MLDPRLSFCAFGRAVHSTSVPFTCIVPDEFFFCSSAGGKGTDLNHNNMISKINLREVAQLDSSDSRIAVTHVSDNGFRPQTVNA